MRPCCVVSSVVGASPRAASRAAPRVGLAGLALGVVIAGSTPATAYAQAWVGDQGSLDVNLGYNLAISAKVIRAGGVSLPLSFLKYTGNKTMYPHPGGGKYDDGATHATLTDLKAAVRYQLLE